MHIFSFRAVRACILWAKHWTAPAAAAASNCTGPSAAGSRQGGTPPAVFSGSGKNSRPGAEMMSGTAAYCCRSVHHQVTKQFTMCWYILIIRGKALPERCWNVSKKNIRTTYNIEGMPEDEKNVPFYEKHGFQRMEHGAAIQICNYSDKR